MRKSNTRKKVLRWILADLRIAFKKAKIRKKLNEAYHKMINSRPRIYW